MRSKKFDDLKMAVESFEKSSRSVSDYEGLFSVVHSVLKQGSGLVWSEVTLAIDYALNGLPENKWTVVDEFLAKWRTKALEQYTKIHTEYMTVCNAVYIPTPEEIEAYKTKHVSTYQLEENVSREKRYNAKEQFLKLLPKFLAQDLKYYGEYQNGKEFFERLNKSLDRDVASKRKSFIRRVEEVIGTVQNTRYLIIGANGEINGVVEGDKGSADVETIYAGGFNIQCLHFRTLVKKRLKPSYDIVTES